MLEWDINRWLLLLRWHLRDIDRIVAIRLHFLSDALILGLLTVFEPVVFAAFQVENVAEIILLLTGLMLVGVRVRVACSTSRRAC